VHEIDQWKNADLKVIKKHFGALLKVWPKQKKYRKWSSDHYNLTISILIVFSIVNARGGYGEADLC